jgi:hypothetical protein
VLDSEGCRWVCFGRRAVWAAAGSVLSHFGGAAEDGGLVGVNTEESGRPQRIEST